MTSLGRKVIGITSLGHALSHVYILALAGSLVPISKYFDVTLTELTAAGTLCYLLFGLGAFPAGLIAMRTNAKLTLKLFFLLSALASLSIGFANRFFLFSAGLAILGSVGSLYHVSGLTLISHSIPGKGKAMGIHGVAGSAGIALAPVIAGLILSLWGWQWVYRILALPGLLGFLFLSFDKSIPTAHVQVKQVKTTAAPQKSHIRIFVIALLVMGVNGLIYRGFMTVLPTYISQNVSVTNFSAVLSGGIFSTLILSIGMVGQYTGGVLSDRYRMTKLYFIFVAATLPFMLMMGFSKNLLLLIVAFCFALFHFPQQPIENHLIASVIPPKWVSSGYGVKFTFTFGFGSAASVLTGWIADHHGLENVFPVLSVLVLLSATLVFVLNRSRLPANQNS